ncbi:asparagine synthase-related protein [Rhizorhabdus sp. FW153]|uniref:asparagine synthase-related protein n=1 Tax=Rhizorhabdus sp. FW153 TaxID=3400216 RepID=UPI003CEF5ADB
MRLIAGVLQLDGRPAEPNVLARMASAMTPPGLHPSLARWLEGPVGLLALDFSGDEGPLPESGGWTVVPDLRLDRPSGPAHVDLVRAIDNHGPDFPDRLDGDFAVALWHRGRGELWLGRDFIGVRPLAWTWQSGRHFAFASLPKGLHGSGLASSAPDPVALARKASQTYFSGADSGFTDIRYLEAGHSLCLRIGEDRQPQPHRAYRPCASQVGQWRGTPEQAATQLRALVEEAVTVRMPTSGPIATHLTGGLDSSSITVLAARRARERGESIVALNRGTEIMFGPEELDERPLIEEVLRQEANISYRFIPDVLPMPGRQADPDWPGGMIGDGDDLIMETAAAAGADRLLSGVGGDEGATYNGARLYLSLLKTGRWPTLLREMRARAVAGRISLPRVLYRQLGAPLLAAVLGGNRPGPADSRLGATRYLAPTIVERVNAGRLRPVLHSNRAEDRVRAFADHHIPSRCTYYSVVAARHGIAVSFPLLDRRIVDFALSLPLHLLVGEGLGRQPFRRAMRGILPERVRLTNAKVGLFDQRFRQYAQLRPVLLDDVAHLRALGLPSISEMFDLDAISAGIESFPAVEDIADRSARGERVLGKSPWVLVYALNALIMAREIADKAAAQTDLRAT